MSTPRLNILCVDDEERALEAMRRMLRSFGEEWGVRFAGGGAQALEILKTEPCDIIISDMRMPAMNGVQLLSIVRQRYPDTIRFILSAPVDQDDLIQNVGPVHQFLQKPCDAETMRGAIARAWRLRGRLAVSKMRSLATSLETLPSLPDNHRDLLIELEQANASAESIARIIARDMSMTAKAMQLVNSAFFVCGKRVTNPSEAVSRLGLRTIKMIALSLHLFEKLPPAINSGISSAALFKHACFMADRSRRIAQAMGLSSDRLDAAHLAGLLHEIGRLVFAWKLGPEYASLIAKARNERRSISDLEQEQLGVRQGEMGGYLLGLWAFDEEVVDAVTYFERPGESAGSAPTALAAVHLAVATSGDGSRERRINLDHAYLERIGMDGSWQASVESAAA